MSIENGVLQNVAVTFRQCKISGFVLDLISDQHLKEIKIPIGDKLYFKKVRDELFSANNDLKKQQHENDRVRKIVYHDDLPIFADFSSLNIPFKIHITANNQCYELENIKLTDTIYHIKRLISKKIFLNLPVQSQMLFYFNKEINSPNTTLYEYNIEPEPTPKFHLMLSLQNKTKITINQNYKLIQLSINGDFPLKKSPFLIQTKLSSTIKQLKDRISDKINISPQQFRVSILGNNFKPINLIIMQSLFI